MAISVLGSIGTLPPPPLTFDDVRAARTRLFNGNLEGGNWNPRNIKTGLYRYYARPGDCESYLVLIDAHFNVIWIGNESSQYTAPKVVNGTVLTVNGRSSTESGHPGGDMGRGIIFLGSIKNIAFTLTQ